MIKTKIFVSCSSSDYIDDKYKKMGRKLGEFIGKNKNTLVFGSSQSGVMGEIYRKTRENGGKVIAVIPKSPYGILEKVECDEIIETEQDTDQFHILVKDNDAVVVLPGSAGMIAELCLAMHYNHFLKEKKKVIVVNQFGFFDDLLKMFDKIVKEKFAYDVSYDLYIVVNNVDAAINLLKE